MFCHIKSALSNAIQCLDYMFALDNAPFKLIIDSTTELLYDEMAIAFEVSHKLCVCLVEMRKNPCNGRLDLISVTPKTMVLLQNGPLVLHLDNHCT